VRLQVLLMFLPNGVVIFTDRIADLAEEETVHHG
jgi:hypothetical protein